MFEFRLANATVEEKQRAVSNHQDHLEHASDGRKYMDACTQAAKEALNNHTELGAHAPLTGPSVAHYCFDYAQQVCTMHCN